MPGTQPPKGVSTGTTDPQSNELAAMMDAVGAIAKRLDAMMGRKNGDGDDSNGASDQATGEEAVENTGETSEEEAGHATEATGGESTSFGGAKKLASDSARSDRQRRREEDATEEELVAELRASLDHAFQAVKGTHSPLPYASESKRGYLLRSLRPLKHYSEDFKSIDLSKLPDDALQLAYRRVCADCVRVGTDPRLMNQFNPGLGLREVKRTDRSGRQISEFYGPVSAWLDEFRMPTARVKKINRHPDRD